MKFSDSKLLEFKGRGNFLILFRLTNECISKNVHSYANTFDHVCVLFNVVLLSQLGAVTCSFTPNHNDTQIQIKRVLGKVSV
jgi:hypothetical protein